MEFIIENESVTINGLQIESIIEEGQFKLVDKNGDIPLYVENIWSESRIILHLLREHDVVMFLTYSVEGKEFKEVLGTVKVVDVPQTGLAFPKTNPCDFLIGKPDNLEIEGWPLGFKVNKEGVVVKWCGTPQLDLLKNIFVQKYELLDFKDFFVNETYIELNSNFEAEFEFEKDYIYIIKFEIDDEVIETSAYIHEKPTFYFSSIDRFKRRLGEKGLTYIGDDFSVKLNIWDLSNEVYAITGLVDPPEMLKQNEKHLLESYIENKIAYEIVKQNISEITFDEEEFKENSTMRSITVTNFSHSTLGVTPYEILIKGLREFKLSVDDVTKEIKNKFYNRMPSSFPELNLVNNREIFSSQRPSYAGQWTIRKSLKGWYYE